MEHAGDVVDRNLLVIARRSGSSAGVASRTEAATELLGIVDRLAGQSAHRRFAVHDRRRRAPPGCWPRRRRRSATSRADATEAHFERLRAGRRAAETSALHLDLLRDIKPVNAHLVAAAAYPVLESRGELLPTRIRSDD